MVLLIAGALNAIVLILQQQANVTQTIIQTQSSQIGKLNEKISIANLKTANNKFNLTVSNSGGTTAHLVSLYVINTTASPPREYRYSISSYVTGLNTITNLGQTLPITANANSKYTLKIVTDGGNSAVANLAPTSVPLVMSLTAIPPTIAPKANVTLLLAVTNNNTAYLPQPISANMSASCSGCTIVKQTAQGNNTLLSLGQTIFFKWVYNIDGSNGTAVIFTAKIVNGNPGNSAKEEVQIKLLAAGSVVGQVSCFQCDAVVDQFELKPNIYATFPMPFGIPSIASQQGLWGITVVNPTAKVMDVSRIVVQTFVQYSNNNPAVFTSGCANTAVSPSTGTWGCPADNTLEWLKGSNPVSISPRSAAAFGVLVPPGNTGAVPSVPAFDFNIAVFTNEGQFSKAAYSSNFADFGGPNKMPLVNVYFAKKTNSTNLTTDWLGTLTNVSPGAPLTLNVTLADLETNVANGISAGSTLNVNIPPVFTGVTVTKSGGFTAVNVTRWSDNSWLVTAKVQTTKLNGGSGGGNLAAITLQITMTAPNNLTANQIFVLFATTSGIVNTSSNFPIGAISEFPIEVNHP